MSFFETHKHQLSLHGVIFLWGFTGILGRLIQVSSTSIVWWRILIAVSGLILFMIVAKRSLLTTTNNIVKYLITGCITAGHWVFFFEALKVSNVSITLTSLASTSLFVALLEPLFFKRKVIGYEILFGLLTLVGLGLIFQAETEHSLGVVLSLISAFLAALFGTLNGVYVKHDRPSLITAYELIGGLIGLTIYLYFLGGAGIEIPIGIDWAWLAILGLVCTSFAFVISIEVMKTLSPFTVSISINMEPIYAIIFALIIFKEEEYMSPMFYIGAALVMSMIFMNSYIKRKSATKRQRFSNNIPA
ncbi:MAG: DMT family transporter [Flavobacteriales bacterium]